MLVWVTVDETSTTGDSPLTVTVSCSPPTVSSRSRRVVRLTCTTTPSRVWVVNPVSSNATV